MVERPVEPIPVKKTLRVHIDQLPGARMIAGCLATSGVAIAIEEPNGNRTVVYSGNAPHYGEGGFEQTVEQDGMYRVIIDGQSIEVMVQEETAFIHAV